jgi:glycosyltransferase involved in cell wall biosynthesis
MNILQVISSGGYYGAESMLVTLARCISRMGCNCVVAVFRDSRFQNLEVAEEAARQGLPVEIIDCEGRWDRRAVGHLRQLVDRHRIDVVHPHGYKADVYSFAATWPGRAALLCTSHNWPDRRLSMRMYAALDRFVLRRFDRVAVVSEVVASTLIRSGVPLSRMALVRNGVNLERFRNADPALRRELGVSHRTVGFVGRLVPAKGGDVFLRAAQRVLSAYPDVTFVMVGEGPAREEWEGLAWQLGIDGNVVFTGSRKDMPEVYASLDVMVLPSLIEAMPMSVLEAMAASRPVIATRVGAVPKLVIHGETGLLLEPGDADGLTTSILRVLRDPELARRLGESGHAHVAQHFSDAAMARSYIRLYEEAVSCRSANRGGLAFGNLRST